MKHNRWTLGLVLIGALALCNFNLNGQTLDPTATAAVQAVPAANAATALAPASFFTSVQSYFTSFDTNATTFQTERLEVWTGVDQNPDALAAVFGLTYDVGSHWTTELLIRNASVAGTVLNAQGGVGYRLVHYDTQLTMGLDVGYRFARDAGSGSTAYVEPFVDVRKALTANTYAGVRLYYQQTFEKDTSAHSPGILLITGFKF